MSEARQVVCVRQAQVRSPMNARTHTHPPSVSLFVPSPLLHGPSCSSPSHTAFCGLLAFGRCRLVRAARIRIIGAPRRVDRRREPWQLAEHLPLLPWGFDRNQLDRGRYRGQHSHRRRQLESGARLLRTAHHLCTLAPIRVIVHHTNTAAQHSHHGRELGSGALYRLPPSLRKPSTHTPSRLGLQVKFTMVCLHCSSSVPF